MQLAGRCEAHPTAPRRVKHSSDAYQERAVTGPKTGRGFAASVGKTLASSGAPSSAFLRRTGAPSLVYARPRLLITSPQRCTGSQLAVSVRKCALASCSGSTTRLQRHAAMQRWLLASTAALAAAAAPRRVAVTGAGGQTGQRARGAPHWHACQEWQHDLAACTLDGRFGHLQGDWRAAHAAQRRAPLAARLAVARVATPATQGRLRSGHARTRRRAHLAAQLVRRQGG